jgi:hypothetical protein
MNIFGFTVSEQRIRCVIYSFFALLSAIGTYAFFDVSTGYYSPTSGGRSHGYLFIIAFVATLIEPITGDYSISVVFLTLCLIFLMLVYKYSRVQKQT